MHIQQRLVKFVTRTNWIIFFIATTFGLIMSPPDFARGIIFGGLIVTVNFHLLSKTLKKALAPPQLSSHNVILAKYYIRFLASGFIIFVLISGKLVHPLGLILGLSVVVVSITLATMYELTKLIFKEAV
ncbi:MAG: ATP synthase subunit I [Deltaproteobacteria bacterium]|nr:ATP synthase subunit I [Deltaproteobacteria bacterium]